MTVKSAWMRACRTDKGVHAAGQVVSVKMLVKTDLPDIPVDVADRELEALVATVPRLNSILPKDIRVFGIKRTANSFHAKERCDSRFYEYLLPTYALAPVSAEAYLNPIVRSLEEKKALSNSMSIKKEKKEKDTDSDDEAQLLENAEDKEEEASQWFSPLTVEEKALIKDYRISDEHLTSLKGFLAKYKGTKSFHNFTIGKSPSDISSKRHIFDVIVGTPFVREDSIEWISITFHGQSFMLHQIRKMVGLAILALRLGCDLSILDRCFEPSKVNIPKAPSLGLLLDKGIFRGYNAKFAGARDAIDFDEFEGERERLKDELIYPKIFQEEQKYNRFMGWLRCNDEHGGEFSFLVPFIKKNQAVSE